MRKVVILSGTGLGTKGGGRVEKEKKGQET